MAKTALNKVLTEIRYKEKERKMVKETIGAMRRFKDLMKDTLKEGYRMNSGIIDECMALKES
eukprot:15333003-Ditylum_brightwellii.AAC.1